MAGDEVLIAGGGIGGLAAALACHRAGAAVQVVERAPVFGEVGAGIQIGPNVTRILHAWGLVEALAQVAAFPDRLQVRSARTGGELGVLPLGARAVQRYGAPYATVHRADLHQLLLTAWQAQGGAAPELGAAIRDFSASAASVDVQLEDGRQWSGAALVGADGLWSQVRQVTAGRRRSAAHRASGLPCPAVAAGPSGRAAQPAGDGLAGAPAACGAVPGAGGGGAQSGRHRAWRSGLAARGQCDAGATGELEPAGRCCGCGTCAGRGLRAPA